VIKVKYDIGIVGAGVAGLSTALHTCSKIDGSIIIVDKGRIGDPRKTSPFTFPDIIERYGLGDSVLQRYKRFTYRSPTGVSATFEYEEPAFVTLNYEKACRNMLDRIRKEGNVDVLENVEVRSFKFNKSFIQTKNLTLTLSDSDNITIHVLVDASGKSFLAARKLGLKLPPLYSHSYGELLEGCEVEDPHEMCILAGKKYGNGGGWFYPIDERTSRFGFATVTRTSDFPMGVVKQNFVKAREEFYPYYRMIKNARTIRPEFGTIPLGPLRKFVHPRILIVGDAAGQATPWYCEGVRPALESGALCAEILCEAYRKKNYSARILKKYQKKWEAINRKIYSKSAKMGFWSWFRSQEEWDKAVKEVASLTSEQMLRRVRYNQT